jgi:hypothetical protein
MLALDDIKQLHINQQRYNAAIQTVVYDVTSPLIDLLGFNDPPFEIKYLPPMYVVMVDPKGDALGYIDVRVLQERLWILTVEAENRDISCLETFPQIVAFLAEHPCDEHRYCMVTDGGDFAFFKLSPKGEFDTSRSLVLSTPPDCKLETIARILMALGQQVVINSGHRFT